MEKGYWRPSPYLRERVCEDRVRVNMARQRQIPSCCGNAILLETGWSVATHQLQKPAKAHGHASPFAEVPGHRGQAGGPETARLRTDSRRRVQNACIPSLK